jgi:hypothetical protein
LQISVNWHDFRFILPFASGWDKVIFGQLGSFFALDPRNVANIVIKFARQGYQFERLAEEYNILNERVVLQAC